MDNREFEWDNNKERINKEKHNITFRIRIISARTTNKKERNIYDNCYQKDE